MKPSMNLDAYSIETLQLKRKGIRRQLLAKPNLQDIRIAVLGGSTSNELVDLLEVLLLDSGFMPVFYQSEYNRYYEDAVLEPHIVADFQPDITTSTPLLSIFNPARPLPAPRTNFVATSLRKQTDSTASGSLYNSMSTA